MNLDNLDLLDILGTKSIKESLIELDTVFNDHDEIYLGATSPDNLFPSMNIMLNKYLQSLDGLVLDTPAMGYGTEQDAKNRKDLERAKNSMTLIQSLVSVMVQQATLNRRLKNGNREASRALNKEGMFTPRMVYQIKEDIEAISLLHTNYKKETQRLIEEGQIAIKRNAELRLQLEAINANSD